MAWVDAADVLVDRHVVAGGRDVDRARLLVRVAKTQEVPRRVDEGVHRVGLAQSRAATDRAGRLQEPLVEAQRRLACRAELDVLGKQDRELVDGDGHDPVVGAVHDGDRAAPVSLAADQPVPQAVVHLARADAVRSPRNSIAARFAAGTSSPSRKPLLILSPSPE